MQKILLQVVARCEKHK